jgi:predicted nucleotidyltransferase
VTRPRLLPHLAGLANDLATLPGAVAVALGGSRASATHRPDSDWDLGVYYRGSRRPLDPEHVRALGHEGQVSELGEWGPVVNGGAWLTVEDTPVDVLFRDLDTVEGWMEEAEQGRFEILAQNGYLAGAPTYVPMGELALNQPIVGELPRPRFPTALAESAPARWRGQAQVALMFAEGHARADDRISCTGMLANAVLCTAHARLAERSEWALNEKRLVQRADLGAVQDLFVAIGTELGETVAAVSEALDTAPLIAR